MMTDEGTVVEEIRVGDMLREVREGRGLTLADVSAKILVRESYLQNIEDMYVPGVPKGYLSAFLRTYSSFLGLPSEEIIKKFSEQSGVISQAASKENIAAPLAITVPTKFRGVLYAATAAALLVAVGGGVMMFSQSASVSGADITEAGTPVNGARESLLATADREELATQLPLRLTALKAGWLEVRGADGTIFRSRKMAAGEEYFPRIGAGWTITARDGSAFVWNVGDVEIGPMGEAGSAVYALSVDAVALDAQAIAAPALAAFGDSKPTR